MNKKQKTFRKVAAIICLIESFILLISAVGMFVMSNHVNETTVGAALKMLKFKEVLGAYSLTTPSGSNVTISATDLTTLTTEFQDFLVQTAGSLAFWSVVSIVIAVIVLVFAKKDINKKWPIIVGLIACIALGNWLGMAFYIVVLCLRQKKVTLETIKTDVEVTE